MRIILILLMCLASMALADSTDDYKKSLASLDSKYKKAKLKIADKYLEKLQTEQSIAMRRGDLEEANIIDSKIKKLLAAFRKPEVVAPKKVKKKEPTPEGKWYLSNGTGYWEVRGDKASYYFIDGRESWQRATITQKGKVLQLVTNFAPMTWTFMSTNKLLNSNNKKILTRR